MIDYVSMLPSEGELKDVRQALYHSKGPGYFVFRNFIDDVFVQHMLRIWCNLGAPKDFLRYRSKDGFFVGCPNYYLSSKKKDLAAYWNFFWNRPVDEATQSVALLAQILRNRIEQRAPDFDLFGQTGNAACCRIVVGGRGNNVVPPHRDWHEGESFDPRRTQITLFLTRKGEDYGGDGFVFTRNDGERVVFGDDVEVAPGDLAIWRYNNEHAVQNLERGAGQRGFIRMIMPPEFVRESRMTDALRLKLWRRQDKRARRKGASR